MNRDLLIGLVLGLIVGWLAEWVIDWFYWRKKYSLLAGQLDAKKDDLTRIKGIGPKIEDKMNKAGIYTFRQVSQLSSQEIDRYTGDSEVFLDEKSFRKQAKKLSKKARKKEK